MDGDLERHYRGDSIPAVYGDLYTFPQVGFGRRGAIGGSQQWAGGIEREGQLHHSQSGQWDGQRFHDQHSAEHLQQQCDDR